METAYIILIVLAIALILSFVSLFLARMKDKREKAKK